MSWFSKSKTMEIRDNMTVVDLLHAAKVSQDATFSHECLKRAEILAPDSLGVQRALLMHGRLHERDRRAPDFRVIKCYLFHAFEHPEKHGEQEQEAMARELFDDKRLKACLALSPGPQDFLEEYLDELAGQYMSIFVAGDNSHSPKVFGVSNKAMLHKYLAKPVNDIIRNIFLCPFLNEEEQKLLARSMYRAYHRQMEGRSTELDRLLGAELCQALN